MWSGWSISWKLVCNSPLNISSHSPPQPLNTDLSISFTEQIPESPDIFQLGMSLSVFQQGSPNTFRLGGHSLVSFNWRGRYLLDAAKWNSESSAINRRSCSQERPRFIWTLRRWMGIRGLCSVRVLDPHSLGKGEKCALCPFVTGW